MATIYLLKYNNYYNRQIKVPEDITYDSLVANGATTLSTFSNINFKWGDGVNQEIILNYDIQANESPDYCLINEDDTNTVWFVLENARTRKGQAKFTLYRDLITTHFNELKKAPAFIEKASIPATNPLIFNSEQMTYNQIKKEEHFLPDKTACPWLVGYFASNTPQTSGDFSLSPESNVTIAGNHTDWEYYTYTTDAASKVMYIEGITYNASYVGSNTPYERTIGRVLDSEKQLSQYASPGFFIKNAYTKEQFKNYLADVTNKPTGISFDYIENLISATYDNNDISDIISNYDGKDVAFDDGVFNVKLVKDSSDTEVIDSTSSNAVLYVNNTIEDLIKTAGGTVQTVYPMININVQVYKYKLVMTKVAKTTGEYTYQLSSAARQLNDAPYKMFAIPYPAGEYNNGCYVLNAAGTSPLTAQINKDLSARWITDLAKQLGSNLYDVQILPYCPIVNSILGAYSYSQKLSRFTVPADATEGVDYMILYNGETKANICFFPKVSTFSFAIQYLEFEGNNVLKSINSVLKLEDDVKVQSETQVCRLTSPNFNGTFEFNIAKNGGVDYFNIDCTYKPYSPYIQVQPNFGGLYGKDFNDARGLILNGDFSIPIVSDKWVEYEIQNKNYQNIFNRQIENMEVNNAINNQEASWGILAGAVQGTTSGALAGGMIGGGYGAAAGAVIGGATSALAGEQDYLNLQARQQETLDYTKDQFGYQLGNIKALPYNLTKVSSLNAISKYFPFVEVYDCTDEEKDALKNKLKYNGMSVGVIGKIEDYLLTDPSYIKCKIIRFEDIPVDYHEAIVIAEELNKGVFM